MPMGKIADSNTRVCVTMPKNLKDTLQCIATEQNRSLNNLIVTILKTYTEQGDSYGEDMRMVRKKV